jgi:hypothetical protein
MQMTIWYSTRIFLDKILLNYFGDGHLGAGSYQLEEKREIFPFGSLNPKVVNYGYNGGNGGEKVKIKFIKTMTQQSYNLIMKVGR